MYDLVADSLSYYILSEMSFCFLAFVNSKTYYREERKIYEQKTERKTILLYRARTMFDNNVPHFPAFGLRLMRI